MKFVNLTPHAVMIRTENGDVITIPPDGMVARVSEIVVECFDKTIDIGVQCFTRKLGDVVGVPEPVDNTGYIVSAMVADHPNVRNRDDVYSPGPAIRDDAGRIVGCRGLFVPCG